METLSKTLRAETTQRKELCSPPAAPSGVVSDSLSLPSYKDYPSHRPFIHTLVYHAHQTRSRQSCPPSSPTKAFPETSSAEILSALRNLQEKIRMLELEKGHVKRSLHTAGKDASHTRLQGDDVTRNLSKDPADPERGPSGRSNCNQVLITHLAAAESRCVKLERQLDHMRRMLRGAEADRTGPPEQQVSVETTGSAGQQRGEVFERAQSEKLERLEREHLRLTRTQNNAEMKIRELEMKLQEEEHQRKLVDHKADQLQTGLETNRMLLQAVSPLLSSRRRQEKTSCLKKPSPRPPSSYTEPHYRLSLGDVPFVTGTSVGCSHSVRANVQSVLSLLKRHQPHLCNRRVLNAESRGTGRRGRSDGGSSSSSSSSSSSPAASAEELSELLRTLQEEQRLMSSEQDELRRRLEAGVSDRERRELQREEERLLLKMERKGEQINTLYKHKTHMKKFLRKEAHSRRSGGGEARVTSTTSTRGRCAAEVKVRPGERSKGNLRLLRDMRALQSSLGT